MVNRTTLSGSSTPPVSGPDYMDQVAERLDTLFDASALPLTTIGGTADAVTATLDPPLAIAGTFVDGMKFTLTWGATNTAGVTLAINGGAALPVVDAGGSGLVAGSVVSGLRSLIEYIGGSFRVLSPIEDGSGANSFYWAFTASGTWNKPAGLDDDRMVTVELWGGGGGGGLSGSYGGGGGGGGYRCVRVRVADLPSSVTVTIGSGGAVGTGGGNTTFGAIATAYGGGSTATGGSGAGALSAASGGTPGRLGGGAVAIPGGDGIGFGGGGGGASGGPAFAGGRGGDAVFGGGGGGGLGNTSGQGGLSVIGGAGGDSGSAGTAPGGGGGRNSAGARGEVRVWI